MYILLLRKFQRKSDGLGTILYSQQHSNAQSMHSFDCNHLWESDFKSDFLELGRWKTFKERLDPNVV